MSFQNKLKRKLRGIEDSVENAWNEKLEIERQDQLTAEEKKQRKKALRNEKLDELNQKRRELKNWLRENKTDYSDIPENEPSTSKGVAKAQRHQGRARERLAGIDDPGDLNKAVESELNDPTKAEGYKRELWKIAEAKHSNLGTDPDGYHSQKLRSLRKKHLMTDQQRSDLYKTEAIEELEKDLIGSTTKILKNKLKESAFPELSGLGGEAVPEDGKEFKESVEKLFQPQLEQIDKTVEKYK